jgi:ADP-ribose pyrophosphatase
VSSEPDPQPDSARTVFSGKLLEVRLEDWPAGEREVVRHPGACAVVAVIPSGEVILVRQFREAVRQTLLEIPAGVRDVEGESGPACAARELLEETGHEARAVEALGAIFTSPGFADERIDLFVADAAPGPSIAVAEDGVETVLMPFDDAVSAALAGGITDAKSALALLLVASHASAGRPGLPGILYRAAGASGAAGAAPAEGPGPQGS